MAEIDCILEAWERRRQGSGKLLLASVIATEGSTYRKPGAHMLVTEDGQRIGSVSGGCLEAEVAKKGWWWTADGPAVRTFDTTSEDEDMPFGSGCGGKISIFVERLEGKGELLDVLRQCRAERQSGVMATLLPGGERLLVSANARYCSAQARSTQEILELEALIAHTRLVSFDHGGERLQVFVEAIEAPLSLAIFGGRHDVPPLVRLAESLGWHVTVSDARTANEIPLEPNTVAVVMNHSYVLDRAVVGRLFERPVRYAGVLGPRQRTDRILLDLGVRQLPEWLHAPAGLDLGATTPETIALSIVSEIQAVLACRNGGKLRNSKDRSVARTEEVLYAVR